MWRDYPSHTYYELLLKKKFARCDVGVRAQSWCERRPCEIAGWLMVDAASSTAVALLQLLVVDVVGVCNLL